MSTLDSVNLEEVKTKLYENLKNSGWGDKLKTFILSSEYDKILNTLLAEARAGKRFTPPVKQMFRAFEECPLDKLKVVIIGQDPYPQIYVADGIAFSCGNIGKPEASLRYMFKALEETVYHETYTGDSDLARWSNQGVLMLNCALTTTIHKTGTHYELWRPFLTFLFDFLSVNNPNLIYVFMGKKAQEWAESAPEYSEKIFTSHPASAAYKELLSWDCNDVFNKVNMLTKKQFNQEITW